MIREFINIVEEIQNSSSLLATVTGYDSTEKTVTVKPSKDDTPIIFKIDQNVEMIPIVGYNYLFFINNETVTSIKSLTVDVVLIDDEKNILLIQRNKKPYEGHWALPGGFVDPGEEYKSAAARELWEETTMKVDVSDLHSIGVFDKEDRDERNKHTMSYAYFSKINDVKPKAIASDDARDANWFTEEEVAGLDLAFDHRDIIEASKKFWKNIKES